MESILFQCSSILLCVNLKLAKFPKKTAIHKFPLLLWFSSIIFTFFDPIDLPLQNCFYFLLQSVHMKENLKVLKEVLGRVFRSYFETSLDIISWLNRKVGILPQDGSKINLGTVGGKCALQEQVLSWRSLLVHSELWEHPKRKSSKEISIPICDRLIPGSFLEPWTCRWKPWRVISGVVDKPVSGAFLVTRVISEQQWTIYSRTCPLFLLSSPLCFLKYNRVWEQTDINHFLSSLQRCLYLTNPFISSLHASDLISLYCSSYILSSYWDPGPVLRLVCIASFNFHIPYGVGSIITATYHKRKPRVREFKRCVWVCTARKWQNFPHGNTCVFFLTSSPWTSFISYFIISWRTLRDLEYVKTAVWSWAITSSSLGLSFPFCKILWWG